MVQVEIEDKMFQAIKRGLKFPYKGISTDKEVIKAINEYLEDYLGMMGYKGY